MGDDPDCTRRHLADVARDPDALEAFYRRHVVAVTRFISRRVDDPYTVADLTADVFLAIIDSADTYRPERGSVIGWVFGVARNIVSAERRRAVRETAATRRIAGRRLLDPADIVRLEERIDAESSARRVHQALASPGRDASAAGVGRRRRPPGSRRGGRAGYLADRRPRTAAPRSQPTAQPAHRPDPAATDWSERSWLRLTSSSAPSKRTCSPS